MTPKDVVKAYFEALGKGDFSAALSFFEPNVKWHQPGNHRFAGVKHGIKELGKMLSDMAETTNGTMVVLPNGNLMSNNDFVVMPVKFNGSISDKNIEMTGVDLFKIGNEKIAEVWLFSDNQDVEDKFWE